MFGNLHLRDGRVEFRWKRWRNKKRQEVSCCLMVLFSGLVLLGGGGIGPLLVTGDVVSAGKFGGNASGIGSAIIHGKDGVTLGNATVLGSASALGGGLGQNANALGVSQDQGGDWKYHRQVPVGRCRCNRSWVRRPGGRHGQGLVLPRRRHRECHDHRR